MMAKDSKFSGSGMTSDRARNRLIEQLREHGITNEDVLWVLSKIPRHIFLPKALQSRAYENIALPIGHGQTISQPYIVALMTQLLLADAQRPLKKSLKLAQAVVTRRPCWQDYVRMFIQSSESRS